MQFEMLENEYWWGGSITSADIMPFHKDTVYSIDLLRQKRTQTAPLFLSSKGRFLWSEDPYRISFDHGMITTAPCDLYSFRAHRTPSDDSAPVILEQCGSTLRDAYLGAMKKYFPFEKDIHTLREYYEHPQFNTWMEVIKLPDENNILSYAEEVIAHGYKPGILVIDGGWQKAQGVWEFDPDRFHDPKKLFDRLHELGFIVMIWVSPFRCPEDTEFYNLYLSRPKGEEGVRREDRNYDHLVRTESGEVSIFRWWSGFSAQWNFNLPGDWDHMKKKLQHLIDDYGIDGFKFDGGSYDPGAFINGERLMGPDRFTDLSQAWVRFGSSFPYHEFKDTWKMGGKLVMQRLYDKSHSWDHNGINCLIPHGCFAGLIGSPFLCPDMVGSGSWTAFLYGHYDEELFMRMAESSALFPMMQFSSLPWRHMSDQVVNVCKKMAELHERMYPEIDRIVTNTELTGEPIIRSMEYQFPGHGYEMVNDQFMLGDSILVAPVILQGATRKVVRFPEGAWIDEEGKRYEGNSVQELPAPVEKLWWFRKAE